MTSAIEQIVENSDLEGRNDTTPGQGAAKLREAVNRVLSRDSIELAEALSKSGQSGKIQSTKFMYELSEGGAATDDQEDGSKIRSVVQEWADAPPWTGPLPSEMDDMTDDGLAN
jgi:hypothetical protein